MRQENPLPAQDDPYEQLLDVLSSTLTEYPAWQSFLRALCNMFVCEHAALVLEAWEGESAAPVFLVVSPETLLPAEALYRSEFCRDLPIRAVASGCLALPHSECDAPQHVLALRIKDDQGRSVRLLLWREEAQGAFEAATHNLFQRLTAPLQRSIKLFEHIALLARSQLVSEAAIATADIGIILVSAEGEALLTNAIADELLEKRDALQIIHGQLRALTPAYTATLLAHVRSMAAEQQADPNWQVYTPLALPRTSNPLPLTVIVRPGPAFRPLRSPLMHTAILVLRDPARRPIIPGTSLARLFGLTPAESLLASELARGASLDEAAEQLNVSRNTARSQLQSIFMKTGVNRQGELVRMLLSSAAALSG